MLRKAEIRAQEVNIHIPCGIVSNTFLCEFPSYESFVVPVCLFVIYRRVQCHPSEATESFFFCLHLCERGQSLATSSNILPKSSVLAMFH